MEDKKEINLIKICTDIATLNQFKQNTEECIKSMEADISAIKSTLLGRPSWFVVIVITFLSTLSVGCIIKLLG
jgi:hypothetical protein